MKGSQKNILIIQLIMILMSIINFFIVNIFNNYIYVIFLLTILIILIFIYGIDLKKTINYRKILPNLSIVILSYFIIIYLSGLFIGFNKTIYKIYNISNWANNIIPMFLLIIIEELIRYEIIKASNKDKKIIILQTAIMIMLEISITYKLYDFSKPNELYEFIGIVIIGNIAKNIYMTIQCINEGYRSNIIYRTIMELYIFIVPIVPALGPYINSILNISIPVILSIVVINSINNKKLESPTSKRHDKIVTIIILIIGLIIVLLNSGFFKYQILTIGSNSMKPYMSKGDVILIKNLNKEEIKTIKKGDILVFYYNKKIVSHRVYKVIRRGEELYYKTKGDNNSQVDNNIVEAKEIKGIVKYRIKYIGLPSVWLQELFE